MPSAVLLSPAALGRQPRASGGCQLCAPAAWHSMAQHGTAGHSTLGSRQGARGWAPAVVLTPVQQPGSLSYCRWDSACAFPCSCQGSAAGSPPAQLQPRGRRAGCGVGKGTCSQVKVEQSCGTILMPVCALGRVSVLVSGTSSCSWRCAYSPPFSQLPGAAWSSDARCYPTTL